MLVLLYSLIYTGRFFFPVGERERKERVGLAHNNPPIREDAQGSRARTCTIAIEFSHLSLSLGPFANWRRSIHSTHLSLSPCRYSVFLSLFLHAVCKAERERIRACFEFNSWQNQKLWIIEWIRVTCFFFFSRLNYVSDLNAGRFDCWFFLNFLARPSAGHMCLGLRHHVPSTLFHL